MGRLGNTPLRHTNFFLERGKSFAFVITFETNKGVPYDVTGTQTRLVVEEPLHFGGTEILTKSAVILDAPGGVIQFQLQAIDTLLEPSEYPYDITFLNALGYSTPLLKGVVVIGHNTDDDVTNEYVGADQPSAVQVIVDNETIIRVCLDYADGIPGPMGVPGPSGPQGPKGDQGTPGGVFIQPDEPHPDAVPVYTPIWIDLDEPAPIPPDNGITIEVGDQRYVNTVGDTMQGDLTLRGDATSPLHAVPKQQLDTKVAKAGDLMTGPLTLSGDAVNLLHAVPKQQLDARLATKSDTSHLHSNYLEKAGGAMSGFLSLSGNATAPLHAVPKQQLDSGLATKANSSHTHPYVAKVGDTMTGILTMDVASGSQIHLKGGAGNANPGIFWNDLNIFLWGRSSDNSLILTTSDGGNPVTAFIGREVLWAGGNVLELKGGAQDHVYMGFYPYASNPNLRGAYIGFPGQGVRDFDISVETGGYLRLGAGGGYVAFGSRVIDLNIGNAGISYAGYTAGGGTANNIGIRWASPNLIGGVDNVNAMVLGTVSNRKYKADIVDLEEAPAKLALLRPVEYTPRELDGSIVEGARHIGLIADEVEQVLPGAVVLNHDTGEADAVNYFELVPLLIAAVKDLTARIVELEAR